jgi:hypothetical protein
MGRQARAVHSSRSVSTFASVTLVPASFDQPRRTPVNGLLADALSRSSGRQPANKGGPPLGVEGRDRALTTHLP